MTKAILIGLTLSFSLCSLAAVQQVNEAGASLIAFEGILAKVLAYEVGGSRSALVDLERLVGAVYSSPAQAKQVEQAFIKGLEGQATLAGKDQICRHLSIIGSAASVPALAAMLASGETADMARYALERIPGVLVGQALLPRINSREALALAESAMKDPEVASEAKVAADQLRQKLTPVRKQP